MKKILLIIPLFFLLAVLNRYFEITRLVPPDPFSLWLEAADFPRGGGSTPGGATNYVAVVDCSASLQTIDMTTSNRIYHVFIKSNATYNCEIVINSITNTVSGSLVWIDVQPVSTTDWVVRW